MEGEIPRWNVAPFGVTCYRKTKLLLLRMKPEDIRVFIATTEVDFERPR